MKYSNPHRCAEPLERSVTPNRPLSGDPVGYASQFIVFTAIHLIPELSNKNYKYEIFHSPPLRGAP